MSKKALLILLALCIAFFPGLWGNTKAAASGEGLKLADPLEGSWKPADDPQASFLYRLPQFVPDFPAVAKINQFYREYSFDLTERASVDYEIAAINDRYVSIVLHILSEGGMGTAETISAQCFALDGVYAGQLISLSQLLGLEQTNDPDLLSRVVCDLIWQIVERECQNPDSDYLQHITQEGIRNALSPEKDFYIDQEGNINFCIQAGVIAGEIAGILTFPFSADELLDAVLNRC